MWLEAIEAAPLAGDDHTQQSIGSEQLAATSQKANRLWQVLEVVRTDDPAIPGRDAGCPHEFTDASGIADDVHRLEIRDLLRRDAPFLGHLPKRLLFAHVDHGRAIAVPLGSDRIAPGTDLDAGAFPGDAAAEQSMVSSTVREVAEIDLATGRRPWRCRPW